MKKFIFSLILFYRIVIDNNLSIAQANYKFEAIYIYSFTKYFGWAEETATNQFVIGVYGSSPLMQELISETNGKNVGDKSILVKNFNSLNEIENCQMLFISSEKENDLPDLVKIANSKHILLITEGKNLAQKGAAINLVTVDGKQKFELNETTVKKAGLKISEQILRLAILVK